MQDYRDEKGNTLSSLKIPNPLSISDFYSLVTRTCYHKLDKGTDSRLFSCPYVSKTHKALAAYSISMRVQAVSKMANELPHKNSF